MSKSQAKKRGVKTANNFVSLPATHVGGCIDKTLFAHLLRKKYPNNPVKTLFEKSNQKVYFKSVVSNAFHGVPISESDARLIAKLMGMKRHELFAKKGTVVIDVSITIL